MRTVPRNPTERILYYQAKATQWAQTAGEIGVTEQQVDELDTALVDAKAAMLKQDQAYSAARSATLGLRSAMEKLSNIGSTLMMQIRAKARTGGNTVYFDAQIPLPKKPTTIEEPAAPTGFQYELLGMGWLEISWKCKNPRGCAGTMYEVERQVDGGPFEFLGTVGKKKFIDHSVPRGAFDVIYRIRGIRSTKRGPVAMCTVELANHASPGMVRPGSTMNGTPFLTRAA